MYKVLPGETIVDVCLNACGSIAVWEDVLNLNGFTDWVPTLSVGMELLVPAILNSDVQKNQQLYPANNAPDITNLSTLLSNFTAVLDSDVMTDFLPGNTTNTFINYYTVRANETIGDVLLNATGTFDNWELVLNANSFTDWVPTLSVGQQVIIPTDVEIQNNVLLITTTYPANNSPDISSIDVLISDFIANFTDNWILADGTWNDSGVWIDGDVWID